MSTYETYVCDRCKREATSYIGDGSFSPNCILDMEYSHVKAYGRKGGAQGANASTHASIDLCNRCTNMFRAFMSGHNVELQPPAAPPKKVETEVLKVNEFVPPLTWPCPGARCENSACVGELCDDCYVDAFGEDREGNIIERY